MVTGENEEANEPMTISARDLYNQARQEAAEQADYDVQAGLNRLSAWMREEPAVGRYRRAAKTEIGGKTREEPARIAVLQGRGPLGEDAGYRGPIVCAAAGVTYRQLDYWARTGLVEPSIRAASGSGSQRLYSSRDILLLKLVKWLLDAHVSLQQIRAAVQHVRDRSTEDLEQMTLVRDGLSVYECTSPDELADLLARRQGASNVITLGQMWQEVVNDLSELPAVRAEDGLITQTDDELAARRARREPSPKPTD